MSNLPTAVGAHIYAGGFTEGMRHNLQVLGHLETSKFGVETTKLNLRIDPQIKADANWSWDKRVNVVYANPPCVAFSRLGHQAGLDHPTIADVRSSVSLALRLRPDIFVWECVQQVYTQGRALVDEVTKEFNKLGYHVIVFLTDANLHGAAQRRHRYHLIATRVKLDLFTPLETEMGPTCGEALAQIKPEMDVKNLQVRKYLQWMEPYALPGHALRRVWFHLHGLKTSEPKPEHLRYCPPFAIQRLHERKPSCTLTGGPDFVHPKEWRVLSPGEMAWLSGYPQDWKWIGQVVDRYKQVAKGVTPVIGKYLGQVFRHGIERGQGITPKDGFELIDYTGISKPHWAGVEIDQLKEEWFGLAKRQKLYEHSTQEVVHADLS